MILAAVPKVAITNEARDVRSLSYRERRVLKVGHNPLFIRRIPCWRDETIESRKCASEAGVTREKFCDDEDITPKELQNFQDWQRQRENRQ